MFRDIHIGDLMPKVDLPTEITSMKSKNTYFYITIGILSVIAVFLTIKTYNQSTTINNYEERNK